MYLPRLEDFQPQGGSEGFPASRGNENSPEYKRGRFWGKSTRVTYHMGIVSLLAGLALAIAPPSGKDVDYVLRWSASAIAFSVCLLELGVILRQRGRSLFRPATPEHPS